MMVVAGIAMGLVKDGDRYAILTDIAGLEDHLGDMDFKVAGTEKGVTAIQMDLKIPSVTPQILREALAQAKQARLQVLAKMKEALPAPRPEISPYAPRIFTLYVNPEKVGEVIGPAGKVIKKIVATTEAKIDIEDDGKIIIASTDVHRRREGHADDPGDHGRSRDRQDLHRQGHPARGIRRLCRDPAQHRRAAPRLRGRPLPGQEHPGRPQDRPGAEVKCISIDEDNKVRVSRKALEARRPPRLRRSGRPRTTGGRRPYGEHSQDHRGRRNRY